MIRPFRARADVAAVALASMLVVAFVLSGCAAVAPSAGPSTSAAPAASVTSITPLTGGVSGGDPITVAGTGLQAVAAVTVGGSAASFTVAPDGTSMTLTAPPAVNFAAGAAPLVLATKDGTALVTESYAYALVSGVDKQLNYVLTYWKSYNTAEYQTLGDNDCVNFTSQSLLMRGWVQDAEWFHKANVAASGLPWRSSTALRNYLAARPQVATALTDAQRDQVVPGDIVQFDWDNSGDRDHTGVVTRVVTTGGKTKVYFAGHTLDSDFRDVDTAITIDHPGGTAYYWHLLT